MKTLFILTTAVLFIVGCGSSRGSVRIVEKAPQTTATQLLTEHAVEQSQVPYRSKNKFKAKDINDTNHSDTYMYPEDGVAAVKDKKSNETSGTHSNSTSTMTKEECIAMISQEKFEKYAAMFGSEAASLKRCTMLKAMNH